MSVKEYSAWCHDCGESFIYYTKGNGKPDYNCPKCKTNKNVTAP